LTTGKNGGKQLEREIESKQKNWGTGLRLMREEEREGEGVNTRLV